MFDQRACCHFALVVLEFRMNGVTSKTKASWRCAWAPDEARKNTSCVYAALWPGECVCSLTAYEHVPAVGLSSQAFGFSLSFALRGLAVSPGKPRVPHCEERPWSRTLQEGPQCVVGWR